MSRAWRLHVIQLQWGSGDIGLKQHWQRSPARTDEAASCAPCHVDQSSTALNDFLSSPPMCLLPACNISDLVEDITPATVFVHARLLNVLPYLFSWRILRLHKF